jgi:hypothetical protein
VRNSPAVLSSAWATDEGHVCAVLVNFTGDPVNAVLKMDLDDYGFEPDDKITMSDYPDRKVHTALSSHRLERAVNLPSRSIVAYEFSAK